MKAIIFDLEATCEDRSIQEKYDNEIIEIGAVKMENGVIVDTFQTFIRPVRTPILTTFCKELTKITQDDVNKGKTFKDAVDDFLSWAGDDVAFLSWGFYDRKQFEKDCRHHGYQTKWLESHRSLKHEHQQLKQLKRPVGVQKALRMEGMTFEGTHHRGIDDAKNIARIYKAVFTDEPSSSAISLSTKEADAYKTAVEDLGGQSIVVNPDSNQRINPFKDTQTNEKKE